MLLLIAYVSGDLCLVGWSTDLNPVTYYFLSVQQHKSQVLEKYSNNHMEEYKFYN